MFRILYSVLLPFWLPFIIYWIYRRKKGIQQQTYPLRLLITAGLGLVFVFLFVFSVPDRAPANSVYTPPKFENGKIIAATLEQSKNGD